MFKIIKKIILLIVVSVYLVTSTGIGIYNVLAAPISIDAQAGPSGNHEGGGGGSLKEPPSSLGFKRDKKGEINRKQRNPQSGNYGYKDSKGIYWVPGNMHAGEEWTREWSDGYIRKHKGKGVANFTNYGSNWMIVAGLGILTGLAMLSPIPGDEILIGGAILGI